MSESLTPGQMADRVKIVHHLVDAYAEHVGAQGEARIYLDVQGFYQWVTGERPSAYDVAATLGVDPEPVERLYQALGTPEGLRQLSSWWPQLMLKDRKTRHPVQSMQLMLLINWADGRSCPMSAYAHCQAMGDDSALNDVNAAQLIAQQTESALGRIIKMGLDGLHDDPNYVTLDDGYQAAQDLKLIASTVNVDDWDEARRRRVVRLLGLVDAMFTRDLTDEQLKAVEQQRQRVKQVQQEREQEEQEEQG